MSNHKINNEFSQELRRLLTSDPAHADTFNPLFQTLINNDAFLKALADSLAESLTQVEQEAEGVSRALGEHLADDIKHTSQVEKDAINTFIDRFLYTNPGQIFDGRDGDFNPTSNYTFPCGAHDTTQIVKHYKSMTIPAGVTVTASHRNKGMIFYVAGDVVINGTLHNDNNAARFVRNINTGEVVSILKIDSQASGLASEYLIPAGGAGGKGGDGYNPVRAGFGGAGGVNCAYGGSGGGGGGGGGVHYTKGGAAGGGGGAGNGGVGGNGNDDGASGVNDPTNGGGGNVGGGTGASGGRGYGPYGGYGSSGGPGGGGIIVIVARGRITVTPTGRISASSTVSGGKGGDCTPSDSAGSGGGGGGGAGGGVIVLSSIGKMNLDGTIRVSGSPGGAEGKGTRYSTGGDGKPGVAGGSGSILIFPEVK